MTNPRIVKSNMTRKAVNSKIRSRDVDTSRFVYHETPTPATDGAQKVFTVENEYTSGLLEVFLDGLLQIKDTDYTETTSETFTFATAPASNENVRVNYIKQ